MGGVRDGYKMTELGEIPSEWEVKSIGDFVVDFRGGAAIKPIDFSDEGIKVLPKKIVDDSSPKMLDNLEHISYLRSEDFKKSKVNSKFLITSLRDLVPTAPSLGKIVKLKVNEQIEFLLAQGVYGFQVNNGLNENFLMQFSHSDIYRKKIQELKVGSTQVHMRQGDFLELKLPYPQVTEQQKISSILSTVDEQINETEQLIVKTKELKKGLMQQLLTKGIGHTEFKQTELGEIPLSWKCKKFEEVMILQRGFDLPSQNREEGEVPILSANGISGYHNEAKVKGPGIVTGRSGTIGKVHYIEQDFWALNTSLYVKEMHNNHPKFLFYLLSDFGIEKYSTGTGVPTLNRNDVHKVLIAVPSSLEEQQKIAQILSTVDDQIEIYEQEKAKYEELKKGLMQQLLTGQIRVKI